MPKGFYFGNVKNLKGKTFGRLIVLQEVEKRDRWLNVRWLCKCQCGNIKIISSRALQNGNTRSCGCLKIDAIRKRFKKDE